MRAGIVGLGSMGFGMAQSLVRAGIKTFGFDTNSGQVEKLKSEGGSSGDLTELAPDLDVLVLVVVNAAQVESILLGKAAVLEKLKKGAVVIACPTVAPEFAKRMEAACQSKGLHYLDAPISGGSLKAAAGELTILASGTPEAFDAAGLALDAMAEKVFRLGDHAGPGSAMKVVNQLLAGVHIAAAAEAITFGISQGVEPAQTVDVISQCAGTSWMFENRGPHIANGDYTPHSAVDIFVKDLGIVREIAAESGFTAPLTDTAFAEFKQASDAGLGGEDDSAVAKIYAERANLKLP